MKLIVFFSALLAFGLIAAPPPKPKAPAAAKAKPAAKAPANVAAARKPVPKAASTAYRAPAYAAKGKPPAIAPRIANSRAVYSRTPVRTAKTPAGRRTALAARQPVVYVPQVPSQERYREIQQALVEKGFFKGEPDGVWNAESVASLKEFQKSQNLDADGKLGSLSLIALGLGPKRIVSAQNTPPPAPPQPQQ